MPIHQSSHLAALVVGLSLACAGWPAAPPAPEAAPAPAPPAAPAAPVADPLPVPAGQVFSFDRDTQPDLPFDFDAAVRFGDDGTVQLATIEDTHHGRFEHRDKNGRAQLRVTRWDRAVGIDAPIPPYLDAGLSFTVVDGGRALRLKDGRRFLATERAPFPFRD